MKRGHGARPLLEFEIRSAQAISKSAMECSRKLGVCYNTYKRYAKMYGLFDSLINKPGKGVKKVCDPNKGRFPIDKILAGEFPKFPYKLIKDKMVKAGIKEDKCDKCNFDEARSIDGRKPILIHFINDDKTDHKLENIEFLCYNCYHNNVGRFFGNEKKFTI